MTNTVKKRDEEKSEEKECAGGGRRPSPGKNLIPDNNAGLRLCP